MMRYFFIFVFVFVFVVGLSLAAASQTAPKGATPAPKAPPE